MASDNSLLNGSADSDGAACIHSIIVECTKKWAEGAPLDESALIDAHPELAEQLTRELAKLRLVFEAADRTIPQDSRGNGQSLSAKWLEPSRGLPVRCPHCRHTFQLLADADLSDITCNSCGDTFSLVEEALDTDDAPPLARLGHFELVSRLGAGAFGTVWKARDLELNRTVAVKLPRADLSDIREQEKFFREAGATAQLQHPNIVAIHDVGREGSTPYIVCDFVRGVTLAHWLEVHRPTSRDAAALCVKIADALQHAHERGVIHRDLKPSNIMLDDEGEPYVMDFGIAKWEAGGATIGLTGVPLGTAAYMPPEQAEGKAHQADGRSDIYSLGVILFELLTGELPFRGSREMILHQAIHDEPPNPRKLNAAVPRDLETICLKCLEKKPEARIASAAELADELTRFLDDRPIQSRPIGRIRRAVRAARRRPAIAAIFTLVTLIAIAGPMIAQREHELREKTQQSFEQAQASLYRALFNELRALIAARQPGYREIARKKLEEALKVNTSTIDRSELRHELVQSMGNFFGYMPTTVLLEQQSSCAALEASGKLAAVGLLDGTIVLVGPGKGAQSNPFKAHDAPVKAIYLSEANGSYVVRSVGQNGEVVRRTFASSFREDQLDAQNEDDPPSTVLAVDGEIASARFSADGRVLATQCTTSVQTWDTATWRPLKRYTPSWTARLNIQSSQGPAPSSSTQSRPALLRRADVRDVIATLAAAFGRNVPLTSVCLSPDGQYVAAGYYVGDPDRCGFFVWPVDPAEEVHIAVDRGGTHENGMAFSHDGSHLAFGCMQTHFYAAAAFDTRLSPAVPVERIRGPEVCALAYSPDGRYVAIYYYQGDIELRHAGTYEIVANLQDPQRIGSRYDIMFSADGSKLMSVHADALRIWDLNAATERQVLAGHTEAIPSLRFMSNGRFLASASKDGTVRIWDVATGKLLRELRFDGMVQCLAFGADDQLLAVATWGRNTDITIWSTADWRPLRTLRHNLGDVCGLGFGRDGRYLAASGRGVQTWEIVTGNGEPDFDKVDFAHGEVNLHLEASPNDDQFAWVERETSSIFIGGFGDISPRLLDGAKIWEGWHGMAFFPEGDRLAFVGRTRELEIWNVRESGGNASTGEQPGKLHSSHIALSADGELIAVKTRPKVVAIWRLSDSLKIQQLVELPETIGEVISMEWNPKKKHLAIGTATGHLSIWRLPQIRSELRKYGLDWKDDGGANSAE